MGNSISSKNSTKIMKITGETVKLKTPIKAEELLKKHPGYVLLESESVKHYGLRSKPLNHNESLHPKRLYFLVELPNGEKQGIMRTRRGKSEIQLTAEERLERLKLSRRSVSDLSIMRPTTMRMKMTVKVKVEKREVEKLMRESKSEREAGEKIIELCRGNDNHGVLLKKRQVHWQKGVNFMTANEGRSEVAVVS